MDFVGVELWSLCERLSQRHTLRNYDRFVAEVARRTVSPAELPRPSEIRSAGESALGATIKSNLGNLNPVLSKFVDGPLFAFLAGRFHTLWEFMKTHELKDEQAAASSMAKSFYPNGVSAETPLIEALNLVVGMLPCSVNKQLCDAISKSSSLLVVTSVYNVASPAAIPVYSTKFEQKAVDGSTRKGFEDLLIDVVLKHSLIPKQWWLGDLASVEKATRVALLVAAPRLCRAKLLHDPATLTLCSSSLARPNQVSTHTLHLEEHLDAATTSGATSALAKKICGMYSSLFVASSLEASSNSVSVVDAVTKSTQSANTEIYKLIVQLQRLIKSGGVAKPNGQSTRDDAPVATSGRGSALTPVAASGPNKADVGLLYRDPDKALQDVDLQDADEFTLQEFKNKMTEKFSERVIKPGDPEYVYDKRVDFKAEKTSEWDDSDDE